MNFHGHPARALALPGGDRCVVALQGAQVLSWTPADGGERLYLSPRAAHDGTTAIRGGIPLCFPQFNQRVLEGRTLPKHGFARNVRWAELGQEAQGEDRIALFVLRDDEATRALWPASFDARVAVRLSPGRLAVGFSVRNTGAQSFAFALALHSYLRVADVATARLHGLDGASFWDAVSDLQQPQRRRVQGGALAFRGETDRVYASGGRSLRLQDGGRPLVLTQSASMPETVVWNPGAALGAQLADLPPEGWREMLCVEAACIDTPVVLPPGHTWQGWQALDARSR